VNAVGSTPGAEEPTASAPPTPEAVPAFHSIGFGLSTIGYAVSHRFRSILAPLGLEPREFALLRTIGAFEGQSQQEAGERLQIPASRMVAFVDGLEERGLAERRINPDDRRTRALFLTDDGRELVGRAFALAAAYEQELCADLSDSEREQLLDLIWRVAGQLGLPEGVHAAHRALADQADEEHCS
jgi:DNA-binding MarR family transcriptional regulator